MKGINKCIQLLLIVIFIYILINCFKKEKKNIEGLEVQTDDPETLRILDKYFNFSHNGAWVHSTLQSGDYRLEPNGVTDCPQRCLERDDCIAFARRNKNSFEGGNILNSCVLYFNVDSGRVHSNVLEEAYFKKDIQDCTLQDVKDNNLGNCVNGEAIGEKIDGNIEQCSCKCNDGYENNLDVITNTLANSCVLSDTADNYLCYSNCLSVLDTLSGNNTEYCNAVENMADLCGRPCTLEGGGTLQSDNVIRKTQSDLMLELSLNETCSFSSNTLIELYIGNNFLKLIYYSLLFELSDYNYENVSSLTSNDRVKLFNNDPDVLIDIKNKLTLKINSECSEMDPEMCFDKERLRMNFHIDFDTKMNNNQITNHDVFKFFLITGISEYLEQFQLTNNHLLYEQYLEKVQNTVEIFSSVYEHIDDYKFDEHIQEFREQYDKSSIKDKKDFSEILDDVIGIDYTVFKRQLPITGLICKYKSSDYDYQNSFLNSFSQDCGNIVKCTNNVDFEDNTICPRLKYKKDDLTKEGKNKDECCDVPIWLEWWYKFIDLFD